MTTAPPVIPGLRRPTMIGRGGYGTVFAVDEPEFGRRVAVKVLSERLDGDDVRRAFSRECQAMGALSGHPNIVTVHRGGFTGTGEPYIVMDLLSGGSLGDRISAGGPLPWAEAVEVGVALAAALETAHRAGILHLDVKPANVLVSRFGDPVLSDFGIARLPGVTSTIAGRIRASAAYASPERLAEGTASVAADLYGLGASLFALLTGRAAFLGDSGDSVMAIIARVVRDPVPDLRERGIPGPVAAVVERLMAKEPHERYATAADVAVALQAAQRELDRPVTRAVIEGSGPSHGDSLTWPQLNWKSERPASTSSRAPGSEPPPAETEIAVVGPPAPAATGPTEPAWPGQPAHQPPADHARPGSTDLTEPARPGRPARHPSTDLTEPAWPSSPPQGSSDPTEPARPQPSGPRSADPTETPTRRPSGSGPRPGLLGTPQRGPGLPPPHQSAPTFIGSGAGPATPPPEPNRRPVRARRRGPLIAIIVGVLVVAAGTTGGILLASRGGGPGPTTTPTATASAAPVPVVALDGSITDPAAADVQRVMSTYISGINQRRYDISFALFTPDSGPAKGGLKNWAALQAATQITDARIISLSDTGNGTRAAELTFTSTQGVTSVPNGKSCSRRHIRYDLVGPGPDYKIRKVTQLEAPQPC